MSPETLRDSLNGAAGMGAKAPPDGRLELHSGRNFVPKLDAPDTCGNPRSVQPGASAEHLFWCFYWGLPQGEAQSAHQIRIPNHLSLINM
jgi:hypothetical protein